MWRCLAARRALTRVTAAAGCILGALAATSGLGVSPAAATVAVPGLDVSSHQISTDWASAASGDMRFAYIKATEGLSVSNARFAAQYDGAYAAGLIRGAYHFAARPVQRCGAGQLLRRPRRRLERGWPDTAWGPER